ncbi:MAG: mandelate racemase/muconate lactonizing enzyme family protein [Gammaproteobacteria bacterium]|nr:mandelate racemase/muconate lactonizing enzyme family protein [Gammaproteobacteria bacterium]MYD77119.1 mandelate racemase/muconate lactonizing enzyme family protein [Gammaproteobacteria bacterium]MYJ52350.1 mandelate racemase/muconate lactonizing enzyme family protein [Gammaproteobacteria bacterium]
MKLTDIETWVTVPPTGIGGSFWVIVRITTDNGIVGIGECYGIPVSGDVACRMVEDTFARYLEGESPFNMETLFRKVYSAGFTQRPDISIMGVFSGMEIAIWDILGKALDQPVYNLLGGRFHDRLRTYTYLYPKKTDGHGNPADADNDVYHDGDAAARRALDYVEMGFTAIKQDPAGPYSFQGGRELSLHELDRCEYNVKRIREAVGNRADILFGTHGQMTTSSAIRLARRLEPYDPLWIEEPCPPDQMDAIGRVARATSIPIATGERLTTKQEFHRCLDSGVAILQPDIGRSGGVWETKKIAMLCELYNAQIAPHIYCGPIAHAAAVHVAFSCPAFLILETIQTDFHDRILKNPLLWEEGYMLPPEGPGLGIELDLDTVLAHPYISGGRLHLEMCQTPLPSDNTKINAEL